jgi:FSR family fosmidomycin resistance protein-like MFS transporter
MKEKKIDYSGVSILSLSHLTHDIYPAFLPALMPFLIEKSGITYGMTGILYFLLRAPSLLNIFIGIIADRISTRYLVIATPAVTAVLMSFVPIINSYIGLCIILFIVGLSSAAYHVPAPVLMKHAAGDKIGTGMSFFMLGGELARTLGPLMLLFTIDYIGYENSYFMMLFGILSSIFVFFKFKDTSVKQDFKNRANPFESVTESWKNLKRIFIIIGGMIFGRSFINAAMISFMPLYMVSKGFSKEEGGLALSVLQLAGAAGAFSSGTLSDRFGRKRLLHIITFSLPVLMFLFLMSSGFVTFLMLLPVGFLLFAMTPVNLALVQDYGHKYPASANSIYMTLNFVISSTIALTFGFLGDIIDLNNAYIIAFIMSFISIPFVFMLKPDMGKNI